MATYILNELVVSQDPAVRRIADSYVWYIFPVVNPDGFVHSHDNVSIIFQFVVLKVNL